jgi:hypothetical protein
MNITGIKNRIDKLEIQQGALPPINIIRTVIDPNVKVDPETMKKRIDDAVRQCEEQRALDPLHPRVMRVIVSA